MVNPDLRLRDLMEPNSDSDGKRESWVVNWLKKHSADKEISLDSFRKFVGHWQ
jgi:hypothetical protein